MNNTVCPSRVGKVPREEPFQSKARNHFRLLADHAGQVEEETA